MSSRINEEDADTVVGGPSYPVKHEDLKKSDRVDESNDNHSTGTHPKKLERVSLHEFSKTADYALEERPFFVPIAKDGIIAALERIDRQLRDSGRTGLLSSKVPVSWTGREVSPGFLGLINHGGLPKILTKPGRYPGFPLRNWWARQWCGTKGLSDTAIQFQAAVISDPQNRIFVVKNSGFVAYAIDGTYDVLAVVDQTHLSTSIKDAVTDAILGSIAEIKMRSHIASGGEQEYVVALFLNIPANNCAILQRGDDLELLPAGQHYITNPNVTLRGLFTLGENQLELPTKDIFTRDQVPVGLRIYLKWQLVEPLKLTTHGYNTPYDALRDKTQSILTQIVAHLDYGTMVKQRSLGPDNLEDGSDPSSAFIDALRTRAMDEMHEAALEYGIVLKDLAVIDREFKGDIALTMDKLTTRALQAQVEAVNVDRENSNKVKQEEGALAVARIKAQSRNAQADSEAYSVIAAAKAQAERTKIEALAEAEAIRLTAEADAQAVSIRAAADAKVTDQFARGMEIRRVEVTRVQAFGNKTVFVPTDGTGVQMGNAMAVGMAAGMANGHEA
ncbi:uncharacterized protein F5147DRAFT_677566 [Suillus discolor]|uniref:Band 7 domain-containing protein n=1 Tax=Suillus discolor TaxID=1912936 RepID=A0A9P7FER5_9AGAM|nr:uncharacterized protein F5147DRAFT_677566 [Suillus discolor]KAG2114650.1 hypothetical protein F5147DRAFT_677566 [Suillus discolor]